MKKEKKDVKKVVKHLKGDIKTFKKEASEDRELISSLRSGRKAEKRDSGKDPKKSSAKQKKVERTMLEFKERNLRSGSKHGPVVTNPKQAIAISLSEAGLSKKKKKKK